MLEGTWEINSYVTILDGPKKACKGWTRWLLVTIFAGGINGGGEATG